MPEAGRGWHWPSPGWAWTMRHPRAIPVGYGTGSLLLGGALGGLGSLLAASWTWSLGGFTIGLGALAAAGFAGSEIARRGRGQMLKRNGIAYVVRERASGWQDDEPAEFPDGLRQRFARVIEVPGPAKLRPSSCWGWDLDEGARHWDEKLDELTRSFRTLYLADSLPGAASTLFIYAWWAVAVGLGARLTAADRRLELSVGQRPGNARAGKVSPDIWAHPPASFDGTAPGASGLPYPGSGEFIRPVQFAVSGRRAAGHADVRVSVLLLRFGRQGWDPFPRVDEDTGDKAASLRVHDRAGLGLGGASEVLVHELRCLPPPGQDRFGWPDIPALAVTAANWVEQKAAELAGGTLLLGAVMPQEIAVGLGICAGQVKRTRWPEHLWPLMYSGGKPYVVPRLDLGSAKFEREAS